MTGDHDSAKLTIMKMGNLTRADGSAIMSDGDATTIQVGIFGPGDVAPHKELPDKATVDVVLKTALRSKETSPEDRCRREFIRSIVDVFLYTEFWPKSMIQVIVQELESNHPLLSYSINGACAALLDSGLAMKATFAAVTLAVLSDSIAKSNQSIKTNPSNEDVEEAIGVVTFVFESKGKNICGIHTEKGFNPGLTLDQFKELLVLGRKEAESLFHLYRETCRKHIKC